MITPHHREYYDDVNARRHETQPQISPPTDFDDPKPISFLSVRGTFLVALSCDPIDGDNDASQARKLIELAWTILEGALTDWGAGGKTSSGYGRMTSGNSTAHLP